MATQSNVLKEFLIALGYELNEPDARRFDAQLKSVTQKFMELGKVALGAGLAMAAALTKTATEMERLYFASQRTGAAVSRIMSLRFAAEQIGVSAEQAEAAVESMAQTLRTQPGTHALLQMLGVKETRDNVQNLLGLVEKLRTMPHFLAAQYAQMFGIDEPTLLMLEKNLPQLVEAQKRFREMGSRAGLDIDKNAEQFHQFMMDLRQLWQGVELLAVAFGVKLLPFASQFVHVLQRGVDFLLSMHKATEGVSTLIGGIVTALGGVFTALKVLRGVGGIFGLGGAAAAGGEALAGGGAAAGAGAVAGGPILWAIIGIVAAAVLVWIALHNDKVRHALGAAYESTKSAVSNAYDWTKTTIQNWIAKFEGKRLKMYPDAGGYSIGFGHHVRPGEDFAAGIDNKTALRLLAQDTAEAMKSVRDLVKVPLSQNQMSALADFVYNVGPEKFARSTMLKDINAGNLAGAAGEFLRWNKTMGPRGLEYSQALMDRRISEKQMFEKQDVSLESKTTINVEGSGDPRATAKAVADEQQRVNGTLVRDLVGAMR